MLDEQDRKLELVPGLLDEPHQLDLLRGIHAGRRLVEQQQLRTRGEGAHDLEPALFPVGQAARGRIAEARQVKQVEQLVDPMKDARLVVGKCPRPQEGVRGPCFAVEVAGRADVVENREAAEEPDVLECAGDAARDDLVDPQAGQVFRPPKATVPSVGW